MDRSIQIDEKEVLRYLGYKNALADEGTLQVIHECIEEVYVHITPRAVYQSLGIKRNIASSGEVFLEIGNMRIFSRHLEKNLEGCQKVILLAATLGREFDVLMQRYTRLEISKAACMQAVGAAAIEAYCDSLQEELGQKRPRFSPGYGDLPLEIQQNFLDSIEATKRIGIYLSEGNIMIPEKSVTAFIGIR